ncbi:hypothetical protein GTO89_12565 [Heliobacterium gestii]|uniref:Uncharacterized protein n=1 Tax=Heliomicrobium gestii TaxID=2699 RepID=A0A845LKD9_HELGE|nr:hypothetical protein [Heliomicrobium gestii]MBM7867592.1 amino acid transporter [Heliomicrobium gestii]MZP43863.1 hypothetical protein [Heliomicrobium gestii]
MLKDRFHGVLSIGIIGLSFVLGFAAILPFSSSLAFGYLIVLVVAVPVIVFSYCSKCLCRGHACGHVFPGKLTRWLPERKTRTYRLADYLGVIVPFLLMVGIPQYWLWKNAFLFGAFWTLLAIAVAEIRAFVCKGCGNEHCPLVTK